MLTETTLPGTTVLGKTIGRTYDLRGDHARLTRLYRRDADGALMMQYRITCLHHDSNTGYGQCSWHGDSRTVSTVAGAKFSEVVTAKHWYGQHRNDLGGPCPWSGAAIDPTSFNCHAEKCPDGCADSIVESDGES